MENTDGICAIKIETLKQAKRNMDEVLSMIALGVDDRLMDIVRIDFEKAFIIARQAIDPRQ
jgi:hypothetical protein